MALSISQLHTAGSPRAEAVRDEPGREGFAKKLAGAQFDCGEEEMEIF